MGQAFVWSRVDGDRVGWLGIPTSQIAANRTQLADITGTAAEVA